MLLDLFCCAGGAAMGYSLAGFDIVGVDIELQPNYPFPYCKMDALLALDLLIGKRRIWDIYDNYWTLAMFSAIHASPPCQDYSVTKTLLKGKQYPRLITDTRERLVAAGKPYIIENVIGSKIPKQPTLDGINGVMLCGTSFGLNIKRHRLFETSFPVPTLPCNHTLKIIDIYGDKTRLRKNRELFPESIGADIEVYWKNHIGVDWMKNREEWREAIPPVYTKYIGKYGMEVVMKKKPELKEAEFESLLDKASQPLEQPQKPDSKEVGTSESPTSGDCSENRTHSDSPEGT
jgi:DNA (cytosine-5)-methyltransferase 1